MPYETRATKQEVISYDTIDSMCMTFFLHQNILVNSLMKLC